MSESKEPKFKVGQRVRSSLFEIEGEVLQDDNGPVVVVRVRVDRGRVADYPYRVPKQALEAVDEKPSLIEADFFELEQRIAAYYIKAAHPVFFINPYSDTELKGGFVDALRTPANRDSEEPSEPAVEVMSLLDALHSSLSLIRAKAMNLVGSGVSTSVNEAFEQLNDLSEVIDELIEQRDTARAEGPEYEFSEEGHTVVPLFVPPGSTASWLFGAGALETQTGHIEGQKGFEFGLATKPAKPGDKIMGERSREPRIRMMFTDDDAIQRLIDDLTRLKESPAVHHVG